MWRSGSLSGAAVFVIHCVSVLDAAPAFAAQGSLYGRDESITASDRLHHCSAGGGVNQKLVHVTGAAEGLR